MEGMCTLLAGLGKEKQWKRRVKLKPNKAFGKNSSLSYGALAAAWDQCYCHPTQVNAPNLNPSQ